AVDESQSSQVEEVHTTIKLKAVRFVGIHDSIEREDFTVLAVSLILDRSEEAVQRANLLLQCDGLDETPSATLSLQQARILQLSKRFTNCVTAHSIMGDEFSIGRKTRFELSSIESSSNVVAYLLPQWGRRVASNLELRSQLVVLEVGSSCRRPPWCGVRRHPE
ncbi:MAG: hypothetical protein RLZZ254_512, partial [Actinomycetota bacterium]